MLFKKTGINMLLALVSLLGVVNMALAATPVKSAPAPAITLEITAPDALPGLAENQKPDPVYLQFTNNNGSAPIYSGAVYAGDSKSVELKITSANASGGQIQFVSNTTGSIQPMSFIYAFSGARLACLLKKQAKIQVYYSINTKLLDVEGVPIDC